MTRFCTFLCVCVTFWTYFVLDTRDFASARLVALYFKASRALLLVDIIYKTAEIAHLQLMWTQKRMESITKIGGCNAVQQELVV
jgi:UV DNA damage repair endonuclease